MSTDIDRGMHVHTWLSTCACAEQSLANVIPECHRLGFSWVVISDHYHAPDRDYAAMLAYNRSKIALLQPHYPDMPIG